MKPLLVRHCLLVLLLIALFNNKAMADLHVPVEQQRTPDQTYLTFPEWFLVFSPAAYADQLEAKRPASAFPYFRHIGQFWSAYWQVIQATRRYPFNAEYHTMIMVIGVSTTIEYALRGSYEAVIGHLTETLAGPGNTPEDELAAHMARDYVDFIRIHPWYEFDFMTPLKRLWELPAWGRHPLRKWERRYLLTSEWGVKTAYAHLIQWATHSSFQRPIPSTWVVVKNSQTADGKRLVELPRYQAFTEAAQGLAAQGLDFVEIAGNREEILVSLVIPVAKPPVAHTKLLIRQPIITRPGFERRVLQVPIPALAALLRQHQAEHVFDF